MGGMPFMDDSAEYDPARALILHGGGEARVAWLADDELRVQGLTEDEAGASALSAPTIALAGLSAAQIPLPLQGARGDQRWSLFLATGEAGNVQAVDLDNASPEGRVDLELEPDTALGAPRLVVAQHPNGDTLIMGRRPAQDEDSRFRPRPVAWQILSADGQVGPLYSDTNDMGLPDQATAGLDGFVLAWGDGTCASLPLPGEQLDGHWICGITAQGALASDGGDHLIAVNPLESGAEIFTATPGQLSLEDERPVGLATLTDLEPLQGQQWRGLEDGVSRLVTIDAEGVHLSNPQVAWPLGAFQLDDAALVAYWDGEAMALTPEITPTASEDLPLLALPEGCDVAPEDCTDQDRDCDGDPRNGQCCVDRAQAADAYLGGTLASSGDSPTLPTALLPGAEIPTLLIGGERENFNDFVINVIMMEWTATNPDAEEGEDPSQPATRVVAQWPEATAPQFIRVDDTGDTALIIAAPSRIGEDELVALWAFRQPDGSWQAVSRSLPCAEPEARLGVLEALLDVRFIGPGEARFYCPNDVRDVVGADYFSLPGQRPTPVEYTAHPYPGDRSLRWMVRRRLVRDGMPQWLILTSEASIDDEADFTLQLWTEDQAEILAPVASDEVDLLNATLDRDGRRYPIHLPIDEAGPTLRAFGPVGKWLEILTGPLGWLPLVNSRWPESAALSPDSAIAYTMGYLVNPGAAFCNACPVGLFVHDLRPGGDWWGRPLQDDLGGALLSADYQGLALTQLPTDGGLPALLRMKALFDLDRIEIQLEGMAAECTPR